MENFSIEGVPQKKDEKESDLHSAFVMDPSSGCCTLPCSCYLVVVQNFVGLRPAAVATYTVGRSFVAGALALGDDTDPFDVFAASFASSSRQNRRHQMMARGMSKMD